MTFSILMKELEFLIGVLPSWFIFLVCSYICLYVCLFYLYVCWFVCFYVSLFYLYVCMYVCFICIFVCVFVCLLIQWWIIGSINKAVNLSIWSSLHLGVIINIIILPLSNHYHFVNVHSSTVIMYLYNFIDSQSSNNLITNVTLICNRVIFL